MPDWLGRFSPEEKRQLRDARSAGIKIGTTIRREWLGAKKKAKNRAAPRRKTAKVSKPRAGGKRSAPKK